MTESSRKLLVVEDDPGLQSQLRWCFDGFDVTIAGDRTAALDKLQKVKPQVVTLDLGLPPDADGHTEGLACLEQILSKSPDTKVIVVTGNDDRANAVHAIGLGAFDFYHKPIDAEILGLLVNRAFRVHELEMENRKLAQQKKPSPLEGVLTGSSEMLKVCNTIEKVAPSGASVLLLGESGTGKELLARSIHALSGRADERFVAINCAAIPETLLESELFGSEKGAFTGAVKQTLGKIELANGGTLFLDEVGDLPMSLQAKLLRFLQERVIERVGGRQEIPVDVRVVCATHKDLVTLTTSGGFRQDLYYRISEITVRIPTLHERGGDVLMLARVFLERFNRQQGRAIRGFTKDAMMAMEAYHWPGNVREMENRVMRAVIMAEGKQIAAHDLELSPTEGEPMSYDLREARDQAERQAVERAMGHVGGKIAQAAELLGVSRPTLYDLIKKYNLST
jgi:two-component system, NtrC family, response regulator